MYTSQTDILHDVTTYSAHRLADLAGCGEPPANDSAGAMFLADLRDAVVWELESLTAAPGASLAEACGTLADSETADELAETASSVYTHDMWHQFVDLSGWEQDVSDVTTEVSTMTERAQMALYLIAENLIAALCDEIAATAASEAS